MVALRKKIDLNQGTEKETRARQAVAARVTTKPGVAGRRMDIVASVRFSQRMNGVVIAGTAGGPNARSGFKMEMGAGPPPRHSASGSLDL